MAGCGCNTTCSPTQKISPKFRKALWIALFLNALMFFVEIIGGSQARSVSLWADALDFFGDAVNYGISLAVIGASLSWRATVALIKGLTMAVFGLVVIGKVIYAFMQGIPPEAITMGIIGVLALIANVVTAIILYAFRDGDANMKSVWLCSRNDAIGNVAVILAGVAVYVTQSKYPDLIVAFVLAFLAIQAAKEIISQALQELG